MPFLVSLSKFATLWVPISLFFVALGAQSAVFATLDRYSVRLGEPVELTLEAEQTSRFPPNLAPLSKDFRIVGTRQMSISSYTTGERRYTTRWKIRLRPLREGEVTVPAIQLGDETTNPLSIVVTPNARLTPIETSVPSALMADIDRNEIYVNSQAILTFKHYHKNQGLTVGASISGLTANNVDVRVLKAPRRYEGSLRASQYNIDEYVLAIFPRFAGTLLIDTLEIHSENGDSNEVTLDTPIEIAVIPKPFQEHPEFWIPADNIEIKDSLALNSSAEAGAPLIRTLQLTAQGVLAETLPAIAPLSNELANIKVTDVTLEEIPSSNGIISRRTETVEIIPQERGELTLRDIAIYWWNNNNETETRLSHPARLVSVAPQPDQTPPKLDITLLSTQNEHIEPSQSIPPYQFAIAAALVLFLLFTLRLIRKKRKKNANQMSAANAPEVSSAQARLSDDEAAWLLQEEQVRFDQVIRACLANDAIIAEDALIEWARFWYPEAKIDYLSDLSETLKSPSINPLIHDLAHHIEQQETRLWRGDLMAEAVVKLRDQIQ